LADWDVEAKHPDDFLVYQFHLAAISGHKAVQAVADSWQKPQGAVKDVLDRLDRALLPQTAAVLRSLQSGIRKADGRSPVGGYASQVMTRAPAERCNFGHLRCQCPEDIPVKPGTRGRRCVSLVGKSPSGHH